MVCNSVVVRVKIGEERVKVLASRIQKLTFPLGNYCAYFQVLLLFFTVLSSSYCKIMQYISVDLGEWLFVANKFGPEGIERHLCSYPKTPEAVWQLWIELNGLRVNGNTYESLKHGILDYSYMHAGGWRTLFHSIRNSMNQNQSMFDLPSEQLRSLDELRDSVMDVGNGNQSDF